MRKFAGVMVGVIWGISPMLAPAQDAQPESTAMTAAPQTICLKMTLQCFQRVPSEKAPALDLTAPDVRTLIPTREFQAMMAEEDPAEAPQSVKVEGSTPAPQVPPGFAGLWWALKHPSQAWRLFTPVQ